jgi:hypothetical protein
MQCQNGSSQKGKRIQGCKRILGSKEIRRRKRQGLLRFQEQLNIYYDFFD